MKVTALAPWFGSNRMLAHRVGELFGKLEWAGIPFAGGMCEIAHIDARTIHVNDLHRDIINLARVVKDHAVALQIHLDKVIVHPDELRDAQERCLRRDRPLRDIELNMAPDFQWAADYFICAWMGRSSISGTDGEFKGKVAVRWNSAGGDSAVRFRSAVEALTEWQSIMKWCTFDIIDCFEFLKKCKDEKGHGIYCDPPFPGPGDGYKHKFTESDHRGLATRLAEFNTCRVVCRFYRHPLVEELYPKPKWFWRETEGGRKQTNDEAPEVLLVNRLG